MRHEQHVCVMSLSTHTLLPSICSHLGQASTCPTQRLTPTSGSLQALIVLIRSFDICAADHLTDSSTSLQLALFFPTQMPSVKDALR